MKKNKIIKRIVELIIIITLIVAFIIINRYISDKNEKSFYPIYDSNVYTYQIEDVFTENGNFYIKGWFIELEKVRNVERKITQNGQLKVLLYELKSEDNDSFDAQETYIGINTDIEYEIRQDINNYFDCEYDYSHCGFVAKLNKNELDLREGVYQIIIKFDEMGKKGLLTNFFIINGELSNFNPKQAFELEVEGTDLELIVSEGKCLASSQKDRICIYQYKKELYWITDQWFSTENEERTIVQYQIDTTQFDYLPKTRIESGNYWDNLGDSFEKYEMTECGKYRVSKRAIPKEYSITQIITGYVSDNHWVWQLVFRPDYVALIK